MLAAIKAALGVKDWPEFTREEVAKHNTAESCWLVAGEKVFDVTEFVRLHPAGPVAILKRAGGCADCTQDYKFHSKGARAQWKHYQVGVLRADEVGKPPIKSAAPDAATIKRYEEPVRFGSVVDQAVAKAVEASPTPEIDDDDDGGEDPVAVGACCRGTAPSEACKTCPNAPKCMRNGTCTGDCRIPAHRSAPQQVGADMF